jgi:hypothetical protein
MNPRVEGPIEPLGCDGAVFSCSSNRCSGTLGCRIVQLGKRKIQFQAGSVNPLC